MGALAICLPAHADGNGGGSRLVAGGILTGEAMLIPLYSPPIFAPDAPPELSDIYLSTQVALTSDNTGAPAVVLAQTIPVQAAPVAQTTSAPATTQAAPAKPASGGEPIMNSDYWLNYFWDIPRFFTAPLRFDTTDWIKTGAFLAAVGGAYMADERLKKFFHDHRSSTSDGLAGLGYRLGDSKTHIFGAVGGYAAGYGLAAVNNGNDYHIRETSLLVMQSFLFSELLAEGAKKAAGRARPSETDDHSKWRSGGQSFFSGHTVNAFSTASVISEQYDSIWVAPVAYGLAGLVAWSRLNDNAHWTSDVVVGAGVGYAIGKLVTHFSPFRENPNMSVSPMGLPGGGGMVLGFRY